MESSPEIFDDIEQGTDAWRQLRLGVVTTSEFQALLTKGRGGTESKTRLSYMRRLAGEIITQQPGETFESAAMIRGHEMEAEARDFYAFMRDVVPVSVGFIRNGRKGCSPDSLVDNDGMLEIKTQRADLLVDTILKDEFPSIHMAQCQGALWVAEREWIDLAIYWPGMPFFVKRTTRDDDFIKDLAAALDIFNAELDAMVEKIRKYEAV